MKRYIAKIHSQIEDDKPFSKKNESRRYRDKEKKVKNLFDVISAAIAPPPTPVDQKAASAAEQINDRQAIAHMRELAVINSDAGNMSEGREPARIDRDFSSVLEGIIANPSTWTEEELLAVSTAIAIRILRGATRRHLVHFGSLQGIFPILVQAGVSAPIETAVGKLLKNLPEKTGRQDLSRLPITATVKILLAIVAAQADIMVVGAQSGAAVRGAKMLRDFAGNMLNRFPGLPEGLVAVLESVRKDGTLARHPFLPKEARRDLRPRQGDKWDKGDHPAATPNGRNGHRGLTPATYPEELFGEVEDEEVEEEPEPEEIPVAAHATAPLGEVARISVVNGHPPVPTALPPAPEPAGMLADEGTVFAAWAASSDENAQKWAKALPALRRLAEKGFLDESRKAILAKGEEFLLVARKEFVDPDLVALAQLGL